jgi:hypothetical protein
VSTLLHAIVYVFLQNLLNVLVQIGNKMRLQKNEDSRINTALTHSEVVGQSQGYKK